MTRTGIEEHKPKVEVRSPDGALRSSWAEARENDRALFVETGHRGTVKIWPGGPIIKWDESGEYEPDIAFTLVGAVRPATDVRSEPGPGKENV